MSPSNKRPPGSDSPAASQSNSTTGQHQNTRILATEVAQVFRQQRRRACEVQLRDACGVEDSDQIIQWIVEEWGWDFWLSAVCYDCEPLYGVPHRFYILRHLSNTGWKVAAA